VWESMRDNPWVAVGSVGVGGRYVVRTVGDYVVAYSNLALLRNLLCACLKCP